MRIAILAVAAGLFSLGCSNATPTTPPVTSGKSEPPAKGHDHSNDIRANMLVAHAGPYHAWLTAHLSEKDGHELDVLIEDEETEKPVGVTADKFTAKATREGDDKTYDLVFEAAPANERPGDKAGTCSRFVAKAPWMKKDDVIAVNAEIPNGKQNYRPKWKKFVPSKYAHHHD